MSFYDHKKMVEWCPQAPGGSCERSGLCSAQPNNRTNNYNKWVYSTEFPCHGVRQVVQVLDFIYVAINKNASSTIQAVLKDPNLYNATDKDIIVGKTNREQNFMRWEKLQEDPRPKYAVVRNPYSRIVSGWNGWVWSRPGGPIVDGINFHRDMQFKDFIKALSKVDCTTVDPHIHLQYPFIVKDNGEPLCKSYIKFENLTEEWEKFCTEETDIRKYSGLTIDKLQSPGSWRCRVEPRGDLEAHMSFMIKKL